MSIPVVSPFVPILNLAGAGLNQGQLYVGVLGEDPKTNPQACFWDAAMTIPAGPQPFPVVGGYVYRSGTPAQLYTATAATGGVYDKNGVQVWIGTLTNDVVSTYQTIPFEFLGGVAPASNEVMGLYPVERSMTFFANFDGSGSGFAGPVLTCLGKPAAGNFTITVLKNGSPAGTITVAQTTGAATFATTDGLSFTMAAGDYLEFVAQTSVDSAFLNVAWTITAQVTA
jgi:hypothetical protein